MLPLLASKGEKEVQRGGAPGRSTHLRHRYLLARIATDDHDSGQMKSVAVSEFKSHCLSLLEDVAERKKCKVGAALKAGEKVSRIFLTRDS